jgi:tetratricopeptide (TPR) repeat protein
VGLFDRLFGTPDPPIDDPERLRAELFAAARAGDARRLERLARANQAAVLAHFHTWQKVPDAVRADPAAVQPYVGSMIALAELFANRLGRPELMNARIGTPASNSLLRWQEALGKARRLLDELRYDEARPLLTDTLIDARGQTGTGVDRYLPITQGYLAEAYFHSGRATEAVPHLEHALAACEPVGDADGVIAYLGSLFEAHRYLGQPAEAAGYADRLAAVSPEREAARWRTRARIARAGEPLNRVVAVVDGATFEVEEVRPAKGLHVQFVFERNRITLRPAVVGAERGERLGQAGQYDEALAALEEAAAADPFDPHARYLGAFTLLHLGRYAEAADRYREVEELAPGWFHCRADAWLADRLAAGQFDQADFLALAALDDGPEAPKEKVALADRLVARRPDLPGAHLHRAKALARSGREADARAALEAGLAADPDPDVRTRLLAELAVLSDEPAVRAARFREAVALNGNLTAAASAALALRLGH